MSSQVVSSPTSAANSSATGAAFSDLRSPSSLPQYDPAVGAALKSLVDQYGGGLVGEPGRLRGLLQDECPRAKREISVLLQALEERIPQDLMRVQSGEPIRSLGPRLVKRLEEEKAMSGDASRWAVQTWAQGLGLAAPAVPQAGAAGAAAGLADASVTFDDGIGLLPQENRLAMPQPQPEPQPLPVPVPKPVPWMRTLVVALLAVALAAGSWFGFYQPKIGITGIEPTSPLVGNGKPINVQLGYEARRAAPQSVEVRYVRGEGNWKTEPTVIQVGDAGGSGSGHIPAGSFSMRTDKPAHVTFSYTLVASNGQRSEPVERTFDIVPPLTITEVSVPRNLVVGKGFDIGIRYARGGADIVKIERRVVQSSVSWGSAESSSTVNYSDPSGSFNYHFEPFTQAMNSTLEFTLVDASGVRSDPYRVVLNVAPEQAPVAVQRPVAPPAVPNAGTVVGVREVHQQGQSSGVGAAVAGVLGAFGGHQVGKGLGRDLATAAGAVAGAFAGNEAEKYARGSSYYEVTVRLDSGATRTVQSPTAWRNGARVRLVGSSLEAM